MIVESPLTITRVVKMGKLLTIMKNLNKFKVNDSWWPSGSTHSTIIDHAINAGKNKVCLVEHYSGACPSFCNIKLAHHSFQYIGAVILWWASTATTYELMLQ